jgi:site-specific DNA recombinase
MTQSTMHRSTSGRSGTASPKTVRVAAYCRKSVDDAPDQEFTSIDAQRSAIEGYIESQRAERWVALPERYDDGGFTGANLERPGFKHLLADIESGKVDLVAVHRLDRLSRSLLHFLQVMETFDKHAVSFISVTQPLFNTATSAGRLMLNVLMSFASYERELIAERTSAKAIAARKKGLWTGGVPPLGYDAVEKKLVVNPTEAERVRAIFSLFADLGSLVQAVEEVGSRGWSMRAPPARNGKPATARPFTTTNVKRILTNPVYASKVVLGGKEYAGAHEAIVDQATWHKVQRLIAERRGDRRPWRRSKHEALLRGLVRCGTCGSTMTVRYTQKGDRKYHYYQCVRILKEGAAACPGSQVPAGRLEAEVVAQIRAVGRKPELLDEVVRAMEREQAERRPELEAKSRKLKKERERLEEEQRKLSSAIPNARDAVGAILHHLGELHVDLQKLSGDENAVRDELDALAGDAVDPTALRQAIEEFDAVWEELFPRERARVLGLLLDSVTYDARRGEVHLSLKGFLPGKGPPVPT